VTVFGRRIVSQISKYGLLFTLMMKAVHSSETLVVIPDCTESHARDKTLYSRHHEHLICINYRSRLLNYSVVIMYEVSEA
jgi:hypothetical protein